MKPRIKIDSSILSFVVILTGLLYLVKGLYVSTPFVDNIFDGLGLILILKGNLFRMSARGHKKTHSQNSQSLVTTGPYSLVRNPMYLGSFLMGAGFVLMLWPWWCLPFFAWLFYLRFKRQVMIEEEFLSRTFGDEYKAYMNKVPAIFPSLKKKERVKIKEVFNKEELFITKEKRGLIGWPILALVLETFQEKLVFGATDFFQTFFTFLGTAIIFFLGFGLIYQKTLVLRGE
ncbi:MAG: hypothetical protein A2Z81_02575 [Omnitrophica WOR_2 bacterium GWA2_45_18]|nr:MAG: hypothetical protein A2Z81_02575 [Omnitrophica WOR_2 bacterium GWA2_45_18]